MDRPTESVETRPESPRATPAMPTVPAAPVAATAPAATPTTPPGPPSVHVRAVLTWLAIFPLVAIGMMLIAPISESWHPIARAFVLTLVVVPLAVYLVVPQLLRGYSAMRRRRSAAARTAPGA